MDKQLFQYKGIKKHMLVILILTVFQGMAIVGQAIFLSAAITNMFKGAAWSAVLPFLFFFGLLLVVRHFIQWMKEKISYRYAEATALDVQNKLVRKIFELGPRVIGKLGSGNTVTLCLEGIPSFRTYLDLFIPRAIAVVIIPIIILVYVFTLDVLSAVALIATMPILVAFFILIGLASRKYIAAQLGTFQVLSRHFVDSLRGLVTLKYLGKSKSHQKSIESVSNKYRRATIKTLRIAFLSSFSLDLFSSLSVAVVAVELGLRLVEGRFGLGPALAILILTPEYFLPIRSLSNDYHATMKGKEAGKQISQLLSMEVTTVAEGKEVLPTWNKSCTLTVQNLSKKADEEERLILRDVNFSVKGFKKVGIVGASGAGKSTLIDLLSGLSHPNSGNFQVNGVPFAGFATGSWQKQITYIPQHPYIFSGTVRENMSWYNPDASEEDIKKAAKITGLTELINRLPRGFDEPIGQGGRDLSGGEEQRIALSRSLLDQRPIMLFDEPTAHLDIETEHDIKKMILPLMENKLVFFATHRLHWMRSMDIIFVMEHGQLVETGTHEELYEKKGTYYNLIQSQGGMIG